MKITKKRFNISGLTGQHLLESHFPMCTVIKVCFVESYFIRLANFDNKMVIGHTGADSPA